MSETDTIIVGFLIGFGFTIFTGLVLQWMYFRPSRYPWLLNITDEEINENVRDG